MMDRQGSEDSVALSLAGGGGNSDGSVVVDDPLYGFMQSASESHSTGTLVGGPDMVHSMPPLDLQDALYDLGGVRQESLEEGLEEPAEKATATAEKVLLKMYELNQYRYEVYPATEKAVIVDCPYNSGSVMALCEANGEVLLFLNANGEQFSERIAADYDGRRLHIVLNDYMRELGVLA